MPYKDPKKRRTQAKAAGIKLRAFRKEHGLCRHCGVFAVKFLCPTHLVKNAAYQKEYRARRPDA